MPCLMCRYAYIGPTYGSKCQGWSRHVLADCVCQDDVELNESDYYYFYYYSDYYHNNYY